MDNDAHKNNQPDEVEIFRQLYAKYYTAMCLCAVRIVREKEVAEELVQDVFLKRWEQRSESANIESIEKYLYRSVYNASMNYLNRQRLENQLTDYYQHLAQQGEKYLSITMDTGESAIIAHELEDKINEAIQSLPEKCREIFKLSRFQSLRNKDIAEQKGVSLNTVEKQIAIALSKLRITLKDFYSIFF